MIKVRAKKTEQKFIRCSTSWPPSRNSQRVREFPAFLEAAAAPAESWMHLNSGLYQKHKFKKYWSCEIIVHHSIIPVPVLCDSFHRGSEAGMSSMMSLLTWMTTKSNGESTSTFRSFCGGNMESRMSLQPTWKTPQLDKIARNWHF